MGYLSSSEIDEIRKKKELVAVIGANLKLNKVGNNYQADCPFCLKPETFAVNPQRQVYHCFACHKGGDVFRFVQDYAKVDFQEAVRRLRINGHDSIAA